MNGRYFDDADKILSNFAFYNDYREGKIDKSAFEAEMTAHGEKIKALGIDNWNFERLKKSPSGDRDIEKMLEEFKSKGGITHADYNRAEYLEYSKKIKPVYENGGFNTAIFPEDELFMFATAAITNPKRMFIAGSYFGYWAIWAMGELQKNNGICTLSDVNTAVIDIAKTNMKNLGFESNAICLAEDAEKLLLGSDEPIDLLALDAYGNPNDSRPTHRGKAIYAPLFTAAKHRMKSGSYVIIHNLERDSADLQPLIKQLDELSSAGVEIETYNGLGLYKIK